MFSVPLSFRSPRPGVTRRTVLLEFGLSSPSASRPRPRLRRSGRPAVCGGMSKNQRTARKFYERGRLSRPSPGGYCTARASCTGCCAGVSISSAVLRDVPVGTRAAWRTRKVRSLVSLNSRRVCAGLLGEPAAGRPRGRAADTESAPRRAPIDPGPTSSLSTARRSCGARGRCRASAAGRARRGLVAGKRLGRGSCSPAQTDAAKVAHEQRHVLRPLAEGRHTDRECTLSRKNRSSRNSPVSIACCRSLLVAASTRTSTLDGAGGAEPLYLALLQDAQHLRLGLERSCRPPRPGRWCRGRPARTCRSASRVAPVNEPLLVAEQLRLDQVVRYRRAVDLHERLAGLRGLAR